MRNWSKYNVNTVRTSPELWEEFRADYLQKFGEVIDQNCKKRYISKFQKLVTMNNKKETHGYKLKLMYDGIIYKGKIYRNYDLIEKDAKYLLKNHPAKESLFDKVPAVEKKK